VGTGIRSHAPVSIGGRARSTGDTHTATGGAPCLANARALPGTKPSAHDTARNDASWRIKSAGGPSDAAGPGAAAAAYSGADVPSSAAGASIPPGACARGCCHSSTFPAAGLPSAATAGRSRYDTAGRPRCPPIAPGCASSAAGAGKKDVTSRELTWRSLLGFGFIRFVAGHD
jgi:hypothetical protein